ncbi:MAG: A/G-specific adenine glycosylase [Verrucomicrobia bacterium]|nr:A/G-specific adenine glycosylase [Verrucomicrobiota bacterium]
MSEHAAGVRTPQPGGDFSFSPAVAEDIRSKLANWFQRAGRTLPWRNEPSPYAVLVSEMMLQQTQVATVVPYFLRWMERLPDFGALAEAPESAVLLLWQGLGYYSRARNLQKSARVVMERFDGRLPSDPALLRTLPGVGAYSAGAIASFAFDRAEAAVDANIARVLSRLKNVQTPVDTPAGTRQIWRLAEALLPAQGGRLYTSSLMELGALVCVAKNPRCLECPIRGECKAVDPALLPIKRQRRATVFLEEAAAWTVRGEDVLLEQQKGRRSGGLWKLPLRGESGRGEPLFQTVYPFTHHKVTLRVFAAAAPVELGEHQRWFSKATVLSEAAMPAGHLRALQVLLKSDPAILS